MQADEGSRWGEIARVTGAGRDDSGAMVLHVLSKSGQSGLLPLSLDAARDLLHAVPLAVLTADIRGTA